MEDKDQNDDKKPGIPLLGDPTKTTPQVKIKGMAPAATSLVQRLMAFKKKDLAFILSGMGVLFMAPLAEHFMMSPESGKAEQGAFKEGWGFRGGDGTGGFGKGSSPYEGGTGGMGAPGSVAGMGSDVITPLNVRDPSALVMGPGATTQPPTNAPQTTSPSNKESSDWKDALAQSANKAGHAATRSAGLPVPKVPLSNGGLRGLGAISGGSGGSYSLPPISASNVPNRPGEGNSLTNVRAAQGYRGAAGARGVGTGGSGGFEALKNAAAKAGTDLNRAGSAATGLENAASTKLPPGGDSAGGGGPSTGAADKGGSQGSNKDGKTTGESLAQQMAKMAAEKALDLEWKKKEKKEMWPIELKQKMFESLLTKGIIDPMGAGMAKFWDIGKHQGASISCWISGKEEPLDPTPDDCPTGDEWKKFTDPYCKQNKILYSVTPDPSGGKLTAVGKCGKEKKEKDPKGDGKLSPGAQAGVGNIFEPTAYTKNCADLGTSVTSMVRDASGGRAAYFDEGHRNTIASSYAASIAALKQAAQYMDGKAGSSAACYNASFSCAGALQGVSISGALDATKTELTTGAAPNDSAAQKKVYGTFYDATQDSIDALTNLSKPKENAGQKTPGEASKQPGKPAPKTVEEACAGPAGAAASQPAGGGQADDGLGKSLEKLCGAWKDAQGPYAVRLEAISKKLSPVYGALGSANWLLAQSESLKQKGDSALAAMDKKDPYVESFKKTQGDIKSSRKGADGVDEKYEGLLDKFSKQSKFYNAVEPKKTGNLFQEVFGGSDGIVPKTIMLIAKQQSQKAGEPAPAQAAAGGASSAPSGQQKPDPEINATLNRAKKDLADIGGWNACITRAGGKAGFFGFGSGKDCPGGSAAMTVQAQACTQSAAPAPAPQVQSTPAPVVKQAGKQRRVNPAPAPAKAASPGSVYGQLNRELAAPGRTISPAPAPQLQPAPLMQAVPASPLAAPTASQNGAPQQGQANGGNGNDASILQKAKNACKANSLCSGAYNYLKGWTNP